MAIIREIRCRCGGTVRIHDDCILPEAQQAAQIRRIWATANDIYRNIQERRLRGEAIRPDYAGDWPGAER